MPVDVLSHLRRRNDGESGNHQIRIFVPNRVQDEGGKTGASSAAQGVTNLNPLRTIRGLQLVTNRVHHLGQERDAIGEIALMEEEEEEEEKERKRERDRERETHTHRHRDRERHTETEKA